MPGRSPSVSHSLLADPALGTGTFELAQTNFNTALKLNPLSAEAELNLGLVFARMGRVDEAIQHYQKAIELRQILLGL